MERESPETGGRTDRAKDALSHERTTLLEHIEKFEQMKYEAFTTAFHAIDTNFREMSARLTSGRRAPIRCQNEEIRFPSGMTFAVQPRDKNYISSPRFSGGEKSLATLAFVSQSSKSRAPFYAFDEVDMSLDSSNLERIASGDHQLLPSHNLS